MARKREVLRLPVVAEAAEHLVQGYLMRRNVLTYQAPRLNKGYDLLCVHPDPSKCVKQIRVQVKSRAASDCARDFSLSKNGGDGFDYLIGVFLNIGNYDSESADDPELTEPEFFTFPRSFVEQHRRDGGEWHWLPLKDLDVEPYRGERGFELIAQELEVEYPARVPVQRARRRRKRVRAIATSAG
jgi:hypothetical protein